MRVVARMAMAIAVAYCVAIGTARADDLYRARTVVTGQGEANRMIGFGACLEDVLVKVSGALGLAGDARLDPYKAKASDFVKAYDYRDQMSGKPKRDEQGTRDRPFDLIVDFDEAKVDAALAALGLKPWPLPRPDLGVIVAMEQGTRRYIIASDDRQSDLAREALLAASAKRGIAVMLPGASALANIDAGRLMDAAPETLALAVPERGRAALLRGHLVWSDDDLAWFTEWRLDGRASPYRWQFRATTFDDAFRRALGGAAQLLSNNGEP